MTREQRPLLLAWRLQTGARSECESQSSSSKPYQGHGSSARDRSVIQAAGVSQGVFARALNVQPGRVSQWKRGERRPSGPSLKLLALVKAKGFDAIV